MVYRKLFQNSFCFVSKTVQDIVTFFFQILFRVCLSFVVNVEVSSCVFITPYLDKYLVRTAELSQELKL